MNVPAGNLPAPSAHTVFVVLGCVCGFNLYLGSTGTMPGALSALLLRALVLCTIPATTTAAAVVLADSARSFRIRFLAL